MPQSLAKIHPNGSKLNLEWIAASRGKTVMVSSP
jgi:hypothetical protein